MYTLVAPLVATADCIAIRGGDALHDLQSQDRPGWKRSDALHYVLFARYPDGRSMSHRSPTLYRRLFRRVFAAFVIALPMHVVNAASFDCAQAKEPDERAICASRQLSEMDVEMAVRYNTLTGLVAMGTRGEMQDEQRVWLHTRAACRGDQHCLRMSYTKRIDALKSEYEHLKSRGPF